MLIATGVYKARVIAVPGNEADGVIAALDYLIASNRKGFGDAVPAFDDGRLDAKDRHVVVIGRSEEHTSELQSLMRISYAVFCWKKKHHNRQLTEKTESRYRDNRTNLSNRE